MAKGCFLSLLAMVIGFLLLIPLELLFNYMNWPGFNGMAMHAGTWIFAWWLLFGISYVLLLVIERSWRRRSKHSKRAG